MTLFRKLFTKNGDQLAREAIADYGQGKDEFAVISKLEKALKLGLENYPVDQVYLYIGSSYFDLALYNKAKEAYEQAYKINPLNSSVVSNLGISYSKLGELENALGLYKEAIKVNPRNAYAHHNIGFYYYECGDHIQALEHLDKAIQINPGLADSFALKSRCFAHLGRYNDSKKCFKEAKVKGYDNVEGLSKDIEEIKFNNPQMVWSEPKFMEFVQLVSHNDFDLLAQVQSAIKDPVAFYAQNSEKFAEKHLNSFEVLNLIPFILLLDYLTNKGQLLVMDAEDSNYDVICGIENLLLEKYAIEDDLFDDFKENDLQEEAEDLLSLLASRIKINLKLELIDIFYHGSQFLLTAIDSASWDKLRYPYSGRDEAIGRIRTLACQDAINNYLTRYP